MAVAPGQAVNEAAALVLAQHAVAGVVDVVDAFVLLVIAEAAGGDEPGVFQHVSAAVGFSTATVAGWSVLRRVVIAVVRLRFAFFLVSGG
ncbi:hypothetical protein FQZ97_964730 [compost metagenome]